MSQFKRKAFFVISNKGGVGKSEVAKLIAYKMRSKPGLKSVIFDGDVGVQGVASVYGLKGEDGSYSKRANSLKPYSGALLIDARGNAEAVSSQLNYPAQFFLNDFPGGLIDPSPIFGDGQSLISAFNGAEIEVVVVIVVGQDRASSAGVLDAMSMWPGARFVIVKNLGQADSNGFLFLDGSFANLLGNPGKTAVGRGAVITEMPKLDSLSLQFMEVLNMPFDMAIDLLTNFRMRLDTGEDPTVADELMQALGDDAEAVFRPRITRIQTFLRSAEPMFKALGLND